MCAPRDKIFEAGDELETSPVTDPNHLREAPYGSTPKVVRVCLMIGTGACPICDFVTGVFLIVVCLAVVAWMQRHPPKNRWDEPDKRP